eukprot:jgi/Chrzof1/4779/Cz14g26050.t1
MSVAFCNTRASQKRAQLLKELLQRHGGTVHKEVTASTTHVVCNDEVVPGTLDATLQLHNVHLVVAEWICHSIQQGQRQPEHQYRPAQPLSDQQPATPVQPAKAVTTKLQHITTINKLTANWRGKYRALGQAKSAEDNNGVCHHKACGQCDFCIIDQLNAAKIAYVGSNNPTYVFRSRALDKAISRLERLTYGLDTAQDVRRLHLGDKTETKLVEILGTGRLQQTQHLQQDPKNQTCTMFAAVWGAGESTAQKWYAAGCRTLDDIRRRSDLTVLQQFGLKFHDEFQQRIPRDEVREAEAMLRAAALTSLQAKCPHATEESVQQSHAAVLGSYIRNKPDCGDIDFLIVPAASLGHVALYSLMQHLLQQLKAHVQVIVCGQSSPSKDDEHQEERPVHFMGIWKGPSSLCQRRLDIKIYHAHQRAFAVCHLSSGRNFCRALRYWCNKPGNCKALASKYHPQANAFHLSDTQLVPVWRVPWDLAHHKRLPVNDGEGSLLAALPDGEKQVVLGAPVVCDTEQHLFEAVGLEWVPYDMRDMVMA